MDKNIIKKSRLFKTWMYKSRADIDLIYVISRDDSFVIDIDGDYVIAIGGSIKRAFKSLAHKIASMDGIISKLILKKSIVKKSGEYDV